MFFFLGGGMMGWKFFLSKELPTENTDIGIPCPEVCCGVYPFEGLGLGRIGIIEGDGGDDPGKTWAEVHLII